MLGIGHDKVAQPQEGGVHFTLKIKSVALHSGDDLGEGLGIGLDQDVVGKDVEAELDHYLFVVGDAKNIGGLVVVLVLETPGRSGRQYPFDAFEAEVFGSGIIDVVRLEGIQFSVDVKGLDEAVANVVAVAAVIFEDHAPFVFLGRLQPVQSLQGGLAQGADAQALKVVEAGQFSAQVEIIAFGQKAGEGGADLPTVGIGEGLEVLEFLKRTVGQDGAFKVGAVLVKAQPYGPDLFDIVVNDVFALAKILGQLATGMAVGVRQQAEDESKDAFAGRHECWGFG